ncbi:E3 ubiquitin-protein ligase ATL42-like [Dioscorea cayenensis subsp. rotundata]|uniref:RING-type E3 ubiquitin transferase n=1 Tax=Dioscorea cayennensis subsp. rotundata TaxID=55577 RepID=A0AB40ALJ6_DIOCR|nr:E3 ubiquitin-protein ligase ATL42-like [Dioscorea cayenensis subsp. rotundata]
MSTTFILFLFLLLLSGAGAQTPESSPIKYGVSFRPSVGIVIGIFAIMFSLTIVLLMYAKFCHVAATGLFLRESNSGAAFHHLLHPTQQPRFSGVDKTLIESLPFFRFSSLRGSRAGLECAVCLSPFTDAEILRLLPKCKHAFHIDCVDRWLAGHSSCPLCRQPVDASDAEIFNQFSLSSRFSLLNSSSRRSEGHEEQQQQEEEEEAVVELFVERDEEENKPDQFYHKFKHRIIVSDVMFKSRWSDVNSSDLMALNSEMLCFASSKRFDVSVSVKDELEKKRMMEKKMKKMNDFVLGSGDVGGCSSTESLIPPGSRCMSEITKVARFAGERSGVKEEGEEHEKRRRVWLPIARRTVKWFAGGREERVELREIMREDGVIEV